MEGDLNFFENGRRPQFSLKMENNLNSFPMEENLNILVNGRQPQFFQIEDNLEILVNGR